MSKSSVTPAELKALVGRAAQIREGSYVNDEYRYRLDEYQATNMACTIMGYDNDFVTPVSLLLTTAWNDVLDWCERTSHPHDVLPRIVFDKDVYSVKE